MRRRIVPLVAVMSFVVLTAAPAMALQYWWENFSPVVSCTGSYQPYVTTYIRSQAPTHYHWQGNYIGVKTNSTGGWLTTVYQRGYEEIWTSPYAVRLGNNSNITNYWDWSNSYWTCWH